MTYRTKTYIAGDWTGDKDAIDKLYEWNENEHLNLSFTDAHELTQARDDSLNCSIKKSLKRRMDISKTFVLIVGDKTNSLTAGGCQYCKPHYKKRYDEKWKEIAYCENKYSIDNKSYIMYECDEAVKADIKIIVLYKSTIVSKSKCPEVVRDKGIHIAMICKDINNKSCWDYNAIKKAIKG